MASTTKMIADELSYGKWSTKVELDAALKQAYDIVRAIRGGEHVYSEASDAEGENCTSMEFVILHQTLAVRNTDRVQSSGYGMIDGLVGVTLFNWFSRHINLFYRDESDGKIKYCTSTWKGGALEFEGKPFMPEPDEDNWSIPFHTPQMFDNDEWTKAVYPQGKVIAARLKRLGTLKMHTYRADIKFIIDKHIEYAYAYYYVAGDVTPMEYTITPVTHEVEEEVEEEVSYENPEM